MNNQIDAETLNRYQPLKDILQQGIGEIIRIFSLGTYRIQPIRQLLVKRIQQLYITQDHQKQHEEKVLLMVDKVSIFLWVLARAPGIWIMLLNQEKLCSESTQLDLYLFTSKVFKRLVQEGIHYLNEFQEFCNLVTKAIIHFLQFISNQITVIYNINKKIVVEQIDQLNGDTKQMKLLNKYMVFKLLKELNQVLRQKIRKSLQNSIFCYVDPDHIQTFVNYIIDKHDLINFVFGKNKNKNTPEGNISIQDQFVQKVLMLGSNMKKVHYRKAIREDGKKALFLQVQKGIEEDEEVESYLITVDDDDNDELLVYNPAFTRKKWSIQDRASENQSIEDLIQSKGGIVKSMRGAPNQVKIMPKNAHTIGGSLGNCLANLNKYDSVQSFLTDFSKTALVSTSLNFIVSNIPMIGYVLVTGGFSLTFYQILKNNFKNDKRKLQDLGTMLLGSTTSLGTGFIGGLIGSAFIPIPVLGFFLGGLVGGFIGGVTSNAIMKSLQSQKFLSIVASLQKHIQQQGPERGSWTVNKKIIRSLGTEFEYFLLNIPNTLQNRVGCDRHWLALIGFCILTFHETNNQVKQKQKQLKKLKKQGQAQMSEIKVSVCLQMSLEYLQKLRIDLRPNIGHLQYFFKQMFSSSS